MAFTVCAGVGTGWLAFTATPRAVETAPILNAFNGVAGAVADAFDRDRENLRFSAVLRQIVFDDLAEIRSGMLALIKNRSGAYEGKRENIPRVLPDLHMVGALLKADANVAGPIAAFRQKIAMLLPTVDSRAAGNEEPSLLTGSALPRLLRDGIALLAEATPGLGPRRITTSDVILVRDAQALGRQIGASSPRQVSQIAEQLGMFVIKDDAPIYVIEDHEEMLVALALYEKGSVPYLRYTFAAMLGHEWQHGFLHEHSEVTAYSFELHLLLKFSAQGFLPPQCMADIDNVRRRLKEAEQAEAGGIDQRIQLSLKP